MPGGVEEDRGHGGRVLLVVPFAGLSGVDGATSVNESSRTRQGTGARLCLR